jgi:hypothetical protein
LHLPWQPGILVVDEVLAVGDHEFQKKCLGKIEQNGSPFSGCYTVHTGSSGDGSSHLLVLQQPNGSTNLSSRGNIDPKRVLSLIPKWAGPSSRDRSGAVRTRKRPALERSPRGTHRGRDGRPPPTTAAGRHGKSTVGGAFASVSISFMRLQPRGSNGRRHCIGMTYRVFCTFSPNYS